MERRDRSPSVVKPRKFRKLKHLSALIKPKSDFRLSKPMHFPHLMEIDNRAVDPLAATKPPPTFAMRHAPCAFAAFTARIGQNLKRGEIPVRMSNRHSRRAARRAARRAFDSVRSLTFRVGIWWTRSVKSRTHLPVIQRASCQKPRQRAWTGFGARLSAGCVPCPAELRNDWREFEMRDA